MDNGYEVQGFAFGGGVIAAGFAKNIRGFWPRRVDGPHAASLPRAEDEFLEI
jgi:hypothetical protein